MNHDPASPPPRVRKGLGSIALAILAVVVIIFVGYNLYYVVTNT